MQSLNNTHKSIRGFFFRLIIEKNPVEQPVYYKIFFNYRNKKNIFVIKILCGIRVVVYCSLEQTSTSFVRSTCALVGNRELPAPHNILLSTPVE
jgi:hypothetical protein